MKQHDLFESLDHEDESPGILTVTAVYDKALHALGRLRYPDAGHVNMHVSCSSPRHSALGG